MTKVGIEFMQASEVVEDAELPASQLQSVPDRAHFAAILATLERCRVIEVGLPDPSGALHRLPVMVMFGDLVNAGGEAMFVLSVTQVDPAGKPIRPMLMIPPSGAEALALDILRMVDAYAKRPVLVLPTTTAAAEVPTPTHHPECDLGVDCTCGAGTDAEALADAEERVTGASS